MVENDASISSATAAKTAAYVATIAWRARGGMRGTETRRPSSSSAAAMTRIESTTGTQAMNPAGVAVPAGKKAWNTAPQNAALASAPMMTTPVLVIASPVGRRPQPPGQVGAEERQGEIGEDDVGVVDGEAARRVHSPRTCRARTG